MIAVWRAFRKTLIPSLNIWQGGAVYVDVEVAICHATERDIPHGEAIAADVRAICQMGIENDQRFIRLVAQDSYFG
jgi:hypothetical protein